MTKSIGIKVLIHFSKPSKIPLATTNTVTDKKIQPSVQPKIDVKKFEEGSELVFNVSFQIMPEIVDVNFKEIVVEKSELDFKDEDIERALTYSDRRELDGKTSGLGEFGVGMKNAAFKFSPKWHLITKALGEKVEKTYTFDLSQAKNRIFVM